MPGPALPSFEVVARHRPFALLAPTSPVVEVPVEGAPAPQPAPYVSVVAGLTDVVGRVALSLGSGGVRLTGWYDASDGRTGLEVDDGADTTTHRSRRWGRLTTRPDRLALTLTGAHLTVLTHDADGWRARGRVDLEERVDTRDEGVLRGPARRSGRIGDRGRALRRLRRAGPARPALRHHPGGRPGPGRRRPRADRHPRRAGLLRHRAHRRVVPGPADPRPEPPRRTSSSADPTGRACSATTRRTWSATATGGWWRPPPGTTSTCPPPRRDDSPGCG